MQTRKILHADLDAYYAQVEQRDDPALRGKPVAVGKDGSRGVVMTASYEARRFGVGSALPVAHAKRLCPQLVVVPARMEVYRRDSLVVHEIFARYTDLTEPLALDEAYLDVTTPKQGPPSGTLLARSIRRDVAETLGLTVSVGVSYCKFLAKLASGLDKPDGLSVIRPEDAAQLLPTLPVGAFFGVGPKTVVRLAELGIYTGADLLKHSRGVLGHHFGKQGHYLFDAVRGIDERPVTPDRARKSFGAERTFGHDLTTPTALAAELPPLAELLAGRLEGAGVEAGNVIVKLRLASFQLVTRRLPLPRPTADAQVLGRVGAQILSTRFAPHLTSHHSSSHPLASHPLASQLRRTAARSPERPARRSREGAQLSGPTFFALGRQVACGGWLVGFDPQATSHLLPADSPQPAGSKTHRLPTPDL